MRARFHPPRMLLAFDQAVPRAAGRILRKAEKQAEHRRSIESALVEAGVDWQERGQTYALVVVMTALIGGMVLVVLDRPIWGLGTVITAVGALAGSFLWASRRGRQRPESASKDLHGEPG